jgi:hypothetical protein
MEQCRAEATSIQILDMISYAIKAGMPDPPKSGSMAFSLSILFMAAFHSLFKMTTAVMTCRQATRTRQT